MREIRVPMVLAIFMFGVTGLAMVRLIMDLSSTRYFSLMPQPEEAESSSLEAWKASASSKQSSFDEDAADLGFVNNNNDFQTSDDNDAEDAYVPPDSEESDDESERAVEEEIEDNAMNLGDFVPNVEVLTGTHELTPRGGSVASLALSAQRYLLPKPQLTPDVKRSFAYFKGPCKYLCMTLKKKGYKQLPGLSIPAHPEMLIISYKSVSKYYNVKTSIVNQVGYGSACIGGGKGKQLACKEEFSKKFGCDYRGLGVQPAQWNIRYPDDCRVFSAEASKPENLDQIWIVKPGGSFHGSGIKLYKGVQEVNAVYPCDKILLDGVIVQRYLDKPALFAGYKFDFRSYMLIASMNPFVVFYHDGFVRRSEHPYDTSASGLSDAKKHITNSRSQSLENHFFSFRQLQEQLTKESGFPADYMEKVFRPHAMRTTNFLFQAAREKFTHRNGRFQMFALDWMLDADGGMHLLEANGNPQISDYPGVDLTPQIWEDMFELVHLIQVEPELLPDNFGVKNRYRFNNWHMVYNELEAEHYGEIYSPCKFSSYVSSRHPLFSFA